MPWPWSILIPLMNLLLLFATIACGTHWKNSDAVSFVARISMVYAISVIVLAVSLGSWLVPLAQVGFACIYLFVGLRVIKYVEWHKRHPHYVMSD